MMIFHPSPLLGVPSLVNIQDLTATPTYRRTGPFPIGRAETVELSGVEEGCQPLPLQEENTHPVLVTNANWSDWEFTVGVF